MTIKLILANREGPVHVAHADETTATVVARLTEKRIGAVPVVDGGRVVGIFSERDVIHGLCSHGGAALEKPVSAGMTSPVITIDTDTGVMEALALMTRRRIRHLPVVDNDQLIGIVSIGDLVKFRIESIEAEAAAMRDYIAS